MRQRFRPGIAFLGFCGIDLSLFTARCPSHACFQEFFILLCPRLKSAKIDRFWFATFIYFNKRAGVEWVYLSRAFQEAAQGGGFLNPTSLFSFFLLHHNSRSYSKDRQQRRRGVASCVGSSLPGVAIR